MLFPEYNYIDFSLGGPSHRNNVATLEDALAQIKAKTIKTSEIHVSIYRYGKELLEYWKQKGSVSSFRGTCFADYIFIDVDRKDSPIQALEDCKTIIDILIKFDLSINSIKIYWSGYKGFHIGIPTSLIQGIKPHEQFPNICFHFIRRLVGDIEVDNNLYRHLNLLRFPNSLNPKTNKYKIRIYPEELTTLDSLREMATDKDTRNFPKLEIKINRGLTDLWAEALTDLNKLPESTQQNMPGQKTTHRKLCIMHLQQEGAEKGQRHDTVIRLASHYRKEGFSLNETLALMQQWHIDKNPNSGFSAKEMEISVVSCFKNENIDYGCFDPLLNSLCKKECFLYSAKMKEKKVVEKVDVKKQAMAENIMSINLRMEKYKDLILHTQWVSLAPLFPSMSTYIRGEAGGMVIYWIGTTGAGKSIIKHNFNKQIKDFQLNIELELSQAMTFEREMMIALNKENHQIEDLIKGSNGSLHEDLKKGMREFSHVYSTNESTMSVKNIEEYYWYFTQDWLPKELSLKEPVKVPVINVDNLGDVEEAKGSSSNERMEHKVRAFTKLSKKLNVAINIFAHMSRDKEVGKENPGKKQPRLDSARDSGAIENKADIEIGIWRPDDTTMKLIILKNRIGATGAIITCDYLEDCLVVRESLANKGLKEFRQTKMKGDDLPF